jgi:hypothetical protein
VFFGKLRPDRAGLFSPTAPGGFKNHGDETEAGLLTEVSGGLEATLVILISVKGGLLVRSGMNKNIVLEPTGYRKVPSSGGTGAPPGNVDVGRPTGIRPLVSLSWPSAVLKLGAAKRTRREKARPLKLRLKPGGGSTVIGLVADQVVASGAVTSSTTRKRVVAKPVHDAVTERAPSICLAGGNPEPSLKHSDIHGWLNV